MVSNRPIFLTCFRSVIICTHTVSILAVGGNLGMEIGSMLIMNQKSFSNGDPLDEVAGDAPAPTVVDLGGAGVGVAGQVLDVLQRHILSEQVRDRHVPELVQREDLRQPGLPPAAA